MNDVAFLNGLKVLEEQNGQAIGITAQAKFGSEGEYGPVQDWIADPEGTRIALPDDPTGRSDLQGWLRDRRAAFDALVEEYSGEKLAQREAELGAPRQLDQSAPDRRL